VQSYRLSDDELWRAIADNTHAMSALVEQQIELDASLGSAESDSRTQLLLSTAETINRYHLEYCDLTAELRRRYPAA
jgi:hypothetical protein